MKIAIILALIAKIPLVFLIIATFYLLYFALSVRIKRLKPEFYPFVSVFVYAKNAGNTIRRKIENLLEQNYPKDKYEIIVYDNGSVDETEKICTEYAKKGKIKYLRIAEGKEEKKKNIWIINHKPYDRKAPLLDFAIKNFSKGEILLMNDPDVVCEKNWIVDMVQPFKDEKVGGVAGTVHCGNYYKSLMTRLRAVEDEWSYVVTRMVDSSIVALYGANYGLRRKAWEETGHGNSLIEDVDITLSLVNKGWKTVGMSASGVEEEVENLKQYWRQRTRWYRARFWDVLKGKRKIAKIKAFLPYTIQPLALFSMYAIFISGFMYWNVYDVFFSCLPFVLLHAAMIGGFLKIKTGRAFIPFIPLYLTLDSVLFALTFLYVHTLGRFQKDLWPSLEGKYYHSGSRLKRWFFWFEQKPRKKNKKSKNKGG